MVGEDHKFATFEEKVGVLDSKVCRQKLSSKSAVVLLSGRKFPGKETKRVPAAVNVLLQNHSNRTVGSVSLFHTSVAATLLSVRTLATDLLGTRFFPLRSLKIAPRVLIMQHFLYLQNKYEALEFYTDASKSKDTAACVAHVRNFSV